MMLRVQTETVSLKFKRRHIQRKVESKKKFDLEIVEFFQRNATQLGEK